MKDEFPEMTGLSRRNLFNTKKFYQFYGPTIVQQAVALINQQADNQDNLITQKLVSQIPWGHNILIFTKAKDIKEADFYINQIIKNNWSRDTLGFQIKTNLYTRTGKTTTNFKNTLPEPLSDLAQQTLKDPYVFDFMTLTTLKMIKIS